MYESNWLARRLETPVCGWRLYSWLLLLLATSLVGTSVGFGIYADRTRKLSECAELPIRAKGDYDPTQHCLTWSESVGIQAMPDGICPNSCDQHLYDTHHHIRSNQLLSSSTTSSDPGLKTFCESTEICDAASKTTGRTCEFACFAARPQTAQEMKTAQALECDAVCAVCGKYEADGTTCVKGQWSCKTPQSTDCSNAIRLGRSKYSKYKKPKVVALSKKK